MRSLRCETGRQQSSVRRENNPDVQVQQFVVRNIFSVEERSVYPEKRFIKNKVFFRPTVAVRYIESNQEAKEGKFKWTYVKDNQKCTHQELMTKSILKKKSVDKHCCHACRHWRFCNNF